LMLPGDNNNLNETEDQVYKRVLKEDNTHFRTRELILRLMVSYSTLIDLPVCLPEMGLPMPAEETQHQYTSE